MLISITTVVGYTAVIVRTVTIEVTSPSLVTYRRLAATVQTLECQCSQIMATYSTFISLTPTFHSVCSSVFVTSRFDPYRYLVNSVSNINAYLYLSSFDFRVTSASLISIFQTFCSVSNETVNELLVTFLKQTYVSTLLTPENELRARAQSFISMFQEQIPSSFNHLLQLIQDLTQGNQLLPAAYTNSYVQIDQNYNLEIQWKSPLKQNCSCAISTDSCIVAYNDYCAQVQFLNGGSCFISQTGLITINGLQIGCYIVEGTLYSTLECLYSSSCVNTILGQVGINNPGETVLNILTLPLPTSGDRFQINTTLRDIVNELMIENWTSLVNYENYFEQCEPSTCTYTEVRRFDRATTIATILGLVGGISVVLRIVAPALAILFRCRRQIGRFIWARQGK